MSASFEIPDSSLAALLGPLMNEVGAQLATAVIKIAESVARDRADGYMDKAGACAYLKIEERALEIWMKPVEKGGRGLPYFKFDGPVRFSRARIDAWALTLERNTPPIFAALSHAA